MFDEKMIVTDIVGILYVNGKPDKTHSVYSKNLPSYELIYKLSGEITTCFNNKSYNESEGSVRYLPKGENSGYSVDVETQGDCIDIYFNTSSLMPSNAIVIAMNENLNIKNNFLKIYKIWSLKKSGYYHKCMALMYQILYELSKKNENYIPKKQYKMIEPSITYIEQNYTMKDFDYKSLYTRCGISYTYFKKLFVAKFGLTPVKYVNNLKVQYACDLLNSQLYTVTQTAEMSGFENVYYFSKVFKNIIGTNPQNYMRNGK